MSKVSASPEQQRVIDCWGQGMAVLAGAGSGKTTTLVSKCARLLELHPKSRLIAVSFTEKSASDLKAKLSETLLDQSGPGSLNQHWIMTIHGLCAAVIREFPREAGFDGEETVLTEPEAQMLWQKAIENLWIEDLSENIQQSFETLLDRESRDSLGYLLKRLKDLESLGVMSSLATSSDPDSRALEQVGRFVLEKYERFKRRQGVLDFNDLERGADRALQSDRVRSAYHKRFDLILVDEFQDTNPLQAKIISAVARPDASNLCVVGDPKQSIYRFRDADLSVFEEFCSKLAIRQSLTWNFRSLPGIIHFSNSICSKIFSSSEMNFEALVPQRSDISSETSSEIPSEIAGESVYRLNVKTPYDLGVWIQAEMNRGIPLHEMALLVRKIRGNEKWLKALTACGIPIAIGSGGLFWEDPRVREMVSFLKWWDNPGNTLSGAIFFRAPWVGIADLDLDRWSDLARELRESQREGLQGNCWKDSFFSSLHPLAQALKPFLGKRVRPGELLMALLVDQKTEEELWAPLLGLWHRVEELSSGGLDFHGVVCELSTCTQQSRREKEVPAPKNLGQLRVLTLHGAKGLEFNHVILIDFGGKPKVSEMPLLFWDRIQGAYLGSRTEEGDRDRNHPQETKWREQERLKNLAESKRLFYVALTRARNRLVLVCPENLLLSKAPACSSDLSDLQDDWRGWIENSEITLPLLFVTEQQQTSFLKNRSKTPSQPCPELEFRPRVMGGHQRKLRARHSVTEWNLLSRCPLAYEWRFIRPPFFEQVPAPEELSQLTQQELGTSVHRCLEKADEQGLWAIEKEVGSDRFSAEPVVSWMQRSPWMASASLERGREVWTELPFEVPFGPEVLVGSIDRLVYDRDSHRYTVIDFKVTHRPKSAESLLEAYQTQLELYVHAVSRLDQTVNLEQIQAYLVNISSHGLQVVEAPSGTLCVEKFMKQANEVIDGKPGEPKPGALCRVCEFRQVCPAQV